VERGAFNKRRVNLKSELFTARDATDRKVNAFFLAVRCVLCAFAVNFILFATTLLPRLTTRAPAIVSRKNQFPIGLLAYKILSSIPYNIIK
jgi:hypothetical protein